jgi:hypothetical protein
LQVYGSNFVFFFARRLDDTIEAFFRVGTQILAMLGVDHLVYFFGSWARVTVGESFENCQEFFVTPSPGFSWDVNRKRVPRVTLTDILVARSKISTSIEIFGCFALFTGVHFWASDACPDTCDTNSVFSHSQWQQKH